MMSQRDVSRVLGISRREVAAIEGEFVEAVREVANQLGVGVEDAVSVLYELISEDNTLRQSSKTLVKQNQSSPDNRACLQNKQQYVYKTGSESAFDQSESSSEGDCDRCNGACSLRHAGPNGQSAQAGSGFGAGNLRHGFGFGDHDVDVLRLLSRRSQGGQVGKTTSHA